MPRSVAPEVPAPKGRITNATASETFARGKLLRHQVRSTDPKVSGSPKMPAILPCARPRPGHPPPRRHPIPRPSTSRL